MKRELFADYVSDIISFKAATIEALEHPDDNKTNISAIIGRINKTGKWAWLARDGVLEIVSAVTGDRWASWCFGAVVKDPNCCVTCVTEYHYDNYQKLLVTLSVHSNQGMVCLFDLKQSKIHKAVLLPYSITSIEPITTLCGSSLPHDVICDQLKHFYGIVALGTESGRVFLLDMCLDDDTISNEIVPNHVAYITFKMQDIEKKRIAALRRKEHMCIQLDDESHQYGQFVYRRSDNSIIRSYNSDEIYVSSLKYIPQLGTLAVGFNFGCFQLWNLHTPVLDYSSRFDVGHSLVTHFNFQEPENDPRRCCYLWVGRSSPITDPKPEMSGMVSLFQLSYSRKGFEENYGVIYQDLQSCFVRFEYDLMCNNLGATSTGLGSRLIDCYTLEDSFNSFTEKSKDSSIEDEGFTNSKLSLAVFVWEATSPDPTANSECFLGIFDMNRWYQAQMPLSLSFNSSACDQCSYFSFYSLEDVMAKAEPDFILDVYISSSSVCKYISLYGVEQHFYPSSLAFEACVLLETGLIKTNYLGLQRQSLMEMQKKGPAALVNPYDLFNLCLYTGLIPRVLEVNVSSIPLSYQREALLSLALEHNMVDFLAFSIHQWATGEFTTSGCTLRFFLEWAWKKITNIKASFDKLCIPLFDCSGVGLSHASIQTLHQYHIQLQHIATLFHVLLNQAAPTTEQGLRDLETKLAVVTFLSLYLQVVLWFLSCGLLPENNEGELKSSKMIAYPATALIVSYNSKRQELQKLNKVIGETDFLMIDGLTSQFRDSIHNVWIKDGGNGLYPPPSLHALLGIYLLENVPTTTMHNIVMYLFFDLISLLNHTDDHQIIENMNLFEIAFHIPVGQGRLIRAFWLLDHKAFEEALEVLLDPSIKSKDIAPWQHTRIIKSFIYQCQSHLALKYSRVRRPTLQTPESVKLHLTVLLDNGLITEAFEYQRLCRDRINIEDILQHFFLACQQSKLMDKLLQLPLSEIEDEFLIQYLQESSEPHSLEVLVMHYLQRGRFIEAIRLNEKLKLNILNEHDPKTRERAIARNAIIENYLKILPNIQRKLALEPDRHVIRTKIIRKEAKKPLPLSSVIYQNLASQAVSQATLIATVMEKVSETYTQPPVEFTALKQRYSASFKNKPSPFIGTPVTPRAHSQFSIASDVIYPQINFTESSQISQPISPIKRTGFLGVISPVAPSDSVKKRLSKYASAEALSLLRTPSVHRKPKQTSVSTPLPDPTQSILKVKQAFKLSSSPVKEIFQKQISNKMSNNVEVTPSITPKYESKKDRLHDSRPASLSVSSKHLRFDLPSPDSSVSDASSPLLNSSLNASPRKPLHENIPDLGQDEQIMVVDDEITFTFHKRDQSASPKEVEEIIPPPIHDYVCGTSEEDEVVEIIPPPIYTYECGLADDIDDMLSSHEIKVDTETHEIPVSKSPPCKDQESMLSFELEDSFLTASPTDSSKSSFVPLSMQTPDSPESVSRCFPHAEPHFINLDETPKSRRSQRLTSDMSSLSASSELSYSPKLHSKQPTKLFTKVTIDIMVDSTSANVPQSPRVTSSGDQMVLDKEQEAESMKTPSPHALSSTPRRSPRNKSFQEVFPVATSSNTVVGPAVAVTPIVIKKVELQKDLSPKQDKGELFVKEDITDIPLVSERRRTRQQSKLTFSDSEELPSEFVEPFHSSRTTETKSERETKIHEDTPVPKSFVFSPPITRSRTRRKKPFEESFSDASFVSTVESEVSSSLNESQIKAPRLRKSPRSNSILLTSFVSDSPVNFISPIPEEKLADLKAKRAGQRIAKSLSHGMVLRKNRGPSKKKRFTKLW